MPKLNSNAYARTSCCDKIATITVLACCLLRDCPLPIEPGDFKARLRHSASERFVEHDLVARVCIQLVREPHGVGAGCRMHRGHGPLGPERHGDVASHAHHAVIDLVVRFGVRLDVSLEQFRLKETLIIDGLILM